MSMKVRDLMKALEDLDGDLPILLSQDPEGNGFHTVDEVHLSGWNGTYPIDIGILELTPDLESQGYGEEDVKPNKCVVLWP